MHRPPELQPGSMPSLCQRNNGYNWCVPSWQGTSEFFSLFPANWNRKCQYPLKKFWIGHRLILHIPWKSSINSCLKQPEYALSYHGTCFFIIPDFSLHSTDPSFLNWISIIWFCPISYSGVGFSSTEASCWADATRSLIYFEKLQQIHVYCRFFEIQ